MGPRAYLNLLGFSSKDLKSIKYAKFLGSGSGDAVKIRIPLSSEIGTERRPSIHKSTSGYLIEIRSKCEDGTVLWHLSIVLINFPGELRV
jgi:hypothetical protein